MAKIPRGSVGWADFVRGGAISAAIGLGIALFMYLAAPRFFGLRVFLHGALVGLFIFFSCSLLHDALDTWLSSLTRGAQKLALGLIYFTGGNIGWFVATFLARELSLVHPEVFSIGVRLIVLLSGVIAVVVGFLFYGFEVMRQRLKESVAKLKEHEFAEKELELARSIQRRLLPSPEIEGEGYRVAARNLPARYVAGDFYDAFHLTEGVFGIAVADVAGKGIGASLVMASVKAMLPLIAVGRSAEETLRELNRKLCEELSAREFVALAYACYNPAEATLELANAGLPDPYLLRSGAKPLPLVVPGPRLPLGLRDSIPYQSVRVVLEPGDRFLLLTDGLPEALTAVGDPLGYEALAPLLPSDDHPPGRSLDELLERVRRATSATLEDDWTVLLLEHSGTARSLRAVGADQNA